MSDTINITTTIVEDIVEITTNDNQTVVNIITQPSGTVTKTSDLINDGADGTSTFVETNELAQVATSGSYNDLTDTPTIPTTPNLTQVLNISDRPVITHDVTTGDFTFDTSHIGKYIGFYGEGICDAIIPDDTYDPDIWVNLVGGVGENCTVNFKWQADSKSLLVGGNPTKVISFSAKLTDPTYNGWVWSVSTDELTGNGVSEPLSLLVSQSSTDNPTIIAYSDPDSTVYTGEYVEVGIYNVHSDIDKFKADIPFGNNLIKTFAGFFKVTKISNTRLEIRAYDNESNPSDDILSENKIII